MEKHKPSYYSIIPATVRYDNELSANEKLMYGEITALASKNGSAWASNNYFAELYDVHNRTVSRWISNLEKNEYIKIKLEYKNNSKQVSKRYIYINDIPSADENVRKLEKKVEVEKKKEKDNTPYKEIVEYLNKKTGKRINHKTEGNRVLMRGRFNEGYKLEDFKTVIDNKVDEWMGVTFSDGKPAENYLHPNTLFRPSNFDKYLNEVKKPTKNVEKDSGVKHDNQFKWDEVEV